MNEMEQMLGIRTAPLFVLQNEENGGPGALCGKISGEAG